MRLRFTKMHGLGNDFVMIDAVSQKIRLTEAKIRKLADRRLGIGCDQVLVVEVPTQPNVDFCYRIYNADGSEVEQCGNGARCFARFVREQNLTGKSCISVETQSGIITLNIDADNQVTVDMGAPRFEPSDLPFNVTQRTPLYELTALDKTWTVSALSVGNPHCVLKVDNIDDDELVETLGAALESHASFPQRVNVGFMQIVDRQTVRLRVYERGAGETKACGTGACAAMVAARQLDLIDSQVCIKLPGGDLQIEWQGEGQPVMMTGPTARVFHGQINV